MVVAHLVNLEIKSSSCILNTECSKWQSSNVAGSEVSVLVLFAAPETHNVELNPGDAVDDADKQRFSSRFDLVFTVEESKV